MSDGGRKDARLLSKIFRKLILEIYNSILIGIKSTTFALNVRVSLSLLFLFSR